MDDKFIDGELILNTLANATWASWLVFYRIHAVVDEEILELAHVCHIDVRHEKVIRHNL
jgi:hypothetical protein